MDSIQKASESGTMNEEGHDTPIISRIFSSSSAQRQNYQKLSSPRVRDAKQGAGTTSEQSQLPRLDMRQPDIRVIIPPGTPAGQQTAELPKPSTPSGGDTQTDQISYDLLNFCPLPIISMPRLHPASSVPATPRSMIGSTSALPSVQRLRHGVGLGNVLLQPAYTFFKKVGRTLSS
jgi:hypothetical protein